MFMIPIVYLLQPGKTKIYQDSVYDSSDIYDLCSFVYKQNIVFAKFEFNQPAMWSYEGEAPLPPSAPIYQPLEQCPTDFKLEVFIASWNPILGCWKRCSFTNKNRYRL